MIVTVLVINSTNAAIARQLLPATECMAGGAGRLYLFYQTDGGKNYSFVDPFDGEALVEVNHFASAAAAHTWVEQDIVIRDARTKGVQ